MTPGPFPNPEAKAWHGDGTAPGRVWESNTPPQTFLRTSFPAGPCAGSRERGPFFVVPGFSRDPREFLFPGSPFSLPVPAFGPPGRCPLCVGDEPYPDCWTEENQNMEQQKRLLAMLAERLPADTGPILHSDMGCQYQHPWWRKEFERLGIRQSMSRKGNCLDNAATEQVFGHLKDEGRVLQGADVRDSYEQFKRELDAYIVHLSTRRRQIRLEGRTPEEFRSMSLECYGRILINNVQQMGRSSAHTGRPFFPFHQTDSGWAASCLVGWNINFDSVYRRRIPINDLYRIYIKLI